jgi:transcriptional regulator with XRE-family HTH domain
MLKINEIIRKSGLKKGYIAKKLNISNATLTRYCNGESIPDAIFLNKLAELIEVDIKEFFLEK